MEDIRFSTKAPEIELSVESNDQRAADFLRRAIGFYIDEAEGEALNFVLDGDKTFEAKGTFSLDNRAEFAAAAGK